MITDYDKTRWMTELTDGFNLICVICRAYTWFLKKKKAKKKKPRCQTHHLEGAKFVYSLDFLGNIHTSWNRATFYYYRFT